MKKYYTITRFRAPYTDEDAIEAMDAHPERIWEPKSYGCFLNVTGPFDTQEECDNFYRYKADKDDSEYGVYYYDTETNLYYEYTPAYFYNIKPPRILGESSNG